MRRALQMGRNSTHWMWFMNSLRGIGPRPTESEGVMRRGTTSMPEAAC